MTEIVWKPNDGPQTAFLMSEASEILYGGAAAGGKTDAIIALPLLRCENPRHRSIILRRTRRQLQEVIDRSKELYTAIAPAAQWKEVESRWYWPSGAFTQMGFAEHEDDIMAFKTFEYDMVLFDELTSFTEKMYKFMFSRNRSKSIDLPPLMRAGSNPDDIGAQWVHARFVENREPYRVYDRVIELPTGESITTTVQFIPAKVWDNPKLPHRDAYIAGIMEMDEADAAAYLYGTWNQAAGSMFKLLPGEVAPQVRDGDYYVVRCMDYGFTDSTAVYWLVVYPDGTIEVAGEVYISQVTIDGIATLIKEKEKSLGLRAPVIAVGGRDMFAAGFQQAVGAQSIATMLSNHGVHFQVANVDRLAGWARLSALLRRKQLRVWSGQAPNLLRTLPYLKRDPLRPNDIKGRQEDHAADALRYGIMAIYDLPDLSDEAPATPLATNPRRDTNFDKIMSGLTKKGFRDKFPGI